MLFVKLILRKECYLAEVLPKRFNVNGHMVGRLRSQNDIRELKIRRRGRLRDRHLILSFLAYTLKIDTPESFTTKVSTLISVEGG